MQRVGAMKSIGLIGFWFHPAGRRTNRKLEGRADLVGQQVQRPREDVPTHIYDRDFEKMLGLLKQAESTGSGLLGAAGGSTIRPGANGMYDALHLRYAYWTDQSKAFRLRACRQPKEA